MKMYTGFLGYDELFRKCAINGMILDTVKHDTEGSDFVTIHFKHKGKKIPVVYSIFNGKFIVKRGGKFITEADNLDGTPWFDALLDFIYTSDKQAAA